MNACHESLITWPSHDNLHWSCVTWTQSCPLIGHFVKRKASHWPISWPACWAPLCCMCDFVTLIMAEQNLADTWINAGYQITHRARPAREWVCPSRAKWALKSLILTETLTIWSGKSQIKIRWNFFFTQTPGPSSTKGVILMFFISCDSQKSVLIRFIYVLLESLSKKSLTNNWLVRTHT